MQLKESHLKQDFLRFMLASMAAQWVFALYTMVDGIFVAKGVSELALSAVNLASPYVNFLFSVSLLFAVGVSTIAAMRMGQGKFKEANQAFSQIMAVLVSGTDACGYALAGCSGGISGSRGRSEALCGRVFGSCRPL